jgi:methylated-DNA-[protein]-cysteine S-methyltransferase
MDVPINDASLTTGPRHTVSGATPTCCDSRPPSAPAPSNGTAPASPASIFLVRAWVTTGAPAIRRGFRSTPARPFAARVYAVTRAVGPGETTTYGAIARALGDPAAARSVGAALGANPTPIVVPCHRVLAADGSLHGFSAPGGIATKRRMLEIERAPGFAQAPLFV